MYVYEIRGICSIQMLQNTFQIRKHINGWFVVFFFLFILLDIIFLEQKGVWIFFTLLPKNRDLLEMCRTTDARLCQLQSNGQILHMLIV